MLKMQNCCNVVPFLGNIAFVGNFYEYIFIFILGTVATIQFFSGNSFNNKKIESVTTFPLGLLPPLPHPAPPICDNVRRFFFS